MTAVVAVLGFAVLFAAFGLLAPMLRARSCGGSAAGTDGGSGCASCTGAGCVFKERRDE